MRISFLLMGILLILGCGNSANQAALHIPDQGLSFKLEQRNSVTLAHLPSELRIEIGDITRGRTLLTVWSGREILYREAMQEKKAVPFVWNNEKLLIECVQLDNELIGPDFAYLRLTKNENNSVSPSQKLELSEEEKILRLIEITEKSQITFIRNGAEHTASEAAEHLRRKYEYAQEEIQTAQQFIVNIAGRSSTTNEVYLVKLPDGSPVRAEDWFRDRLREVEQ